MPADPRELRADLHDLAVIDVSPTKLKELLMSFRQPGKARELPLLVAAYSVSATPELLGVLPQFRAMACGPAEMRSLIRHYLNGSQRLEHLARQPDFIGYSLGVLVVAGAQPVSAWMYITTSIWRTRLIFITVTKANNS